MDQRGTAGHRRILPLLAVVFMAILLWRILPAPGPAPSPDPLFSQVPPDVVPLLHADSDSALRAWVRRVGHETTRQASWWVSQNAAQLPLEEYERRSEEIQRYQRRFARLIAEEFNGQHDPSDPDFILGKPVAEQQRLLARRGEIHYLLRQDGMSAERKIDILNGWLAEARQDRDTTAIASCLFMLSDQFARQEKRTEQKASLEAALDLFRQRKENRLACQALGVLGDLYESAGDDSAMVRCYEEACHLANSGRIPDQAGRINAFYAAYFQRRGQLALAHELHYEAMRSCREFKGGAYEIRFVCTAMEFYADLSAWGIVESLLDRAHDLMARYPGDPFTVRYSPSVLQNEARLAMAYGRVDEADAMYRELSKRIGDGWSRVHPAENRRLWAEGLLQNGRFDEALRVAQEGRSLAERYLLPDYAARMTLLAARAEFGRNRYEDAANALEAFDFSTGEDRVTVPNEDIVTRDVLSARISLARGDTAAAVTAATRAMDDLLGFIVAMDPSTHSYLWIERCDGVRRLWHDLTADDPRAGYGLEFFWLDLPRRLGTARPVTASPGPIVHASLSPNPAPVPSIAFSPSVLPELGRRTEARIRRSGSVHCLYARDGSLIRRWTLTADTLRREDLPIDAADCIRLAGRARELLKGNDGDETAASDDDLNRLAAVLLPPEVLAGPGNGEPRTLLVTADGPLAALPFEALDLDPTGTYRPVLADWDVAYLRHEGSGEPRPSRLAGLVVANPEIHLGRGQASPFAPRLAEVTAEAHAVAGHDPGIRLLEGTDAAKGSVQDLWEEAGFLYFASHVTRDPRAPYLAMISLAAPDSATGLESMHLSLEDIRRARFDACDLVVLSGCGSGLPYVTGFVAGPSLGDAFLDAGAAAAVQTLWDVPDAGARRLMTAFADRWLGGNMPPVHALAEVKRAALRESGTGDFAWATYVVELSGPGMLTRLP